MTQAAGTTTTTKEVKKLDQGVIRKRTPEGVRGGWQARLELGVQPAQRCTACGHRAWLDHGRLKACPACGAEDLENVRERRQKSKCGFATKKAAQAWLEGVRVDRREGKYRPLDAADMRMALSEYLTDVWLPFVETQVKPSTALSYRMHCEVYIIPNLGSIRLQDLTPEMVDAFYRDLLETGKTRSKGGLSPRTIRHTHAVLHAALDYWVRKRRLPWNAATLAEPPAANAKPEMQSWTADQRRAFLRATKDDRLHGLWVLLSTLGMRRGEALGLRWEDVRFWGEVIRDEAGAPVLDEEGHEVTRERGSIAIRRNRVSVGGKATEGMPKTGRARVVPLTPSCIAALRGQTAQQLSDSDKWGDAWQDTGYIYTTEGGLPLHPERATKLFYEAVDAAKVPRIRLHDLRHTAATLARQAGVPIEVVSRWLGHQSTEMTHDIYSHVLPEMNDDAVARVEASVTGRS